jgi:hypothetical protein
MASDTNSKLNAAAAARIDPRFPGYYAGSTDADGDFDGDLDRDIAKHGNR